MFKYKTIFIDTKWTEEFKKKKSLHVFLSSLIFFFLKILSLLAIKEWLFIINLCE